MPRRAAIERARSVAGLAGAALLIASSLAHALLGWPPLASALDAAGVDDEGLLGALAVGWLFGSAAMMVFGVIALLAAVRTLRRKPATTEPVLVIAVGYLLFGLAAYSWRDFNPHFLLFIATGAILGIYAVPTRS